MKKSRMEKGITLIALIITIIILLILAVVTIGSIQDSDIITYAQKAASEYEQAQINQNQVLASYQDMIEQSLKTENSDAVKITADNYGDTIEYSAGGVEDWKIFYSDNQYVYIITSSYLDNNLLPTGLIIKKGNATHDALWDSEELANSEGIIIEESIANKYMLDWYLDYSDTENINARKITADLLNTNIWSATFGNKTKGIEAIGTPTLEMLVKSWNAKGYTQLKTECNETGYFVGLSTVESLADIAETANYELGGYGIDLLKSEDMTSYELYFPYQEMKEDCYGYWLASPNSYTDDQAITLDYSGFVGYSTWYDAAGWSIRPVVSVPINLITKDAEGNFRVEQ